MYLPPFKSSGAGTENGFFLLFYGDGFKTLIAPLKNLGWRRPRAKQAAQD
jgi:hypothetical protein